MQSWFRRPSIQIAVLSFVLALAFLGSRGIWDPDEGRYTNVALVMLESGDWLNPKRNHEVGHWTKPPLTYWSIAASVASFGRTPFAARLPMALAYLFTIWLVWRLARRLAPGSEATAAVAFATMLLPFGAAQYVSTDFMLAAFQTLAVYAYVESRFDESRSVRWFALMWTAFALAFLTKGPPALLPLLAILLHERLVPFSRPRALARWSQAAVFLAVAAPWYLAVIHGNPGLLEYFLGEEVVDRFTSDSFNRHGEWYGWIKVYAPTLLLGTLPWTPALWRWSRTLPAQWRRWRERTARAQESSALLLALWILLPLLVFCVARSRMPLYLLPLFVPLALVVARQRQAENLALPRWPALLLWATLLLALKAGVSYWPTHKDAAAWAQAIRARAPQSVAEVVFVEDMARYGLNLHLHAEIEKISLQQVVGARFNPQFDESLALELAEREAGVVYITKRARWPEVSERIRSLGYEARVLGEPYQQRVIFVVEP